MILPIRDASSEELTFTTFRRNEAGDKIGFAISMKSWVSRLFKWFISRVGLNLADTQTRQRIKFRLQRPIRAPVDQQEIIWLSNGSFVEPPQGQKSGTSLWQRNRGKRCWRYSETLNSSYRRTKRIWNERVASKRPVTWGNERKRTMAAVAKSAVSSSSDIILQNHVQIKVFRNLISFWKIFWINA